MRQPAVPLCNWKKKIMVTFIYHLLEKSRQYKKSRELFQWLLLLTELLKNSALNSFAKNHVLLKKETIYMV